VGGLILWLGSFFVDRLRSRRFLAGFLACALIVGPGLIINVVLKDHFGRPRPRQIEKFGGDLKFAPLGEPTFDSRGRSFPSGHASMGFFWFAPAIYFWSRSRRLGWGLIGLGFIHGGLMGFARMAQGGHWLSDVIWSGGIVYLSSWLVYFVLSSNFVQKDSRTK
jgi:membrane-associated PAP2 superfamily phosphatase